MHTGAHQQCGLRSLLAASSFLFLTLLSPQLVAGEEEKGQQANAGHRIFAKVDGYVITEQVLRFSILSESRRRYYHGRITDERLVELQKDVGQRLINDVLVLNEAERRKMVVDSSFVDARIAEFDEKYRGDTEWLKNRQDALPKLRKQFESRWLVQALEKRIRDLVSVSEDQKRAYFSNNQKKFVMPERRKVSLILLKVAPNAPQTKWQEAEQRLQLVKSKITSGYSFAELAESMSDDQTAQQGGDMGYQHRGTLHDEVEDALDTLEVGGLSEPIRVLEGFVLVKLEDVKPEVQLGYEVSSERVGIMLLQEMQEKAWSDFLINLRNEATVEVFPVVLN